jgi:hypothetical protein
LLLCGLHVAAALAAKRSRGRRLLGCGYLRGGGLLRPHGLYVKKARQAASVKNNGLFMIVKIS